MLGRVKWGGLKIGEKRCYTLGYADDLVLMAKGDELKSMMGRFEEYLVNKRLDLNVKKQK